MEWAQIGNSSNVGVFVLLLSLFVGLIILLNDVVDAQLVPFAFGVNHQSSVAATRIALMLHMALFLAVAAHNVGIAGTVVAGRGSVGGGVCWAVLKLQKVCWWQTAEI